MHKFNLGVTRLEASFFMVIIFILASCKPTVEEKPPPPPEIHVVEVVKKDVPIIGEFVGQTYGYYDIAIRARVDGVLESLHFKEGSYVKKNQLLYTIDSAPQKSRVAEAMSRVAEAMSRIAEAETLFAKAESDVKRYRPLAASNAVAQSDLDAAEAQYGASKAQIDAAKASLEAANASLDYANIQLGYTKLYAPISGIIGKTEAKVGDYVGKEPNPVVLNAISRTDTILVRFSITESEYLSIARYRAKQMQQGKLPKGESRDSLQLILADNSIHEYLGRGDFIDRQIDPTTGTLLVQASFNNPDKVLRPGQFAKVRLTIDELPNSMLIPQRSVQEIQEIFNVYVVNEQNVVEVKQVTLGPKVGSDWVVLSGLNPTDKVVVEGIQKIRKGMQVVPISGKTKPENN